MPFPSNFTFLKAVQCPSVAYKVLVLVFYFFHATKGEKQVITSGLTSQEINVFNDVNKIHLRK